MEKILKSKLNSKGLIKTLETEHNPNIHPSDRIEITLDNNLYESMQGPVSEDSIKKWLVDTFKISDNALSRMAFQVKLNRIDDITVTHVILKSTNLENLVDGIVHYMSNDLLIKRTCKVGYYLNYAEISTSLESTRLTIDMDSDVYERLIDLDSVTTNTLYSEQNLVKALKELTTNLSTPIPEIISVSNVLTPDNTVDITYDFAPGENESELLEIFDFITIHDFDEVDNNVAEDQFTELDNVIAIEDISRNRKENNTPKEETKQECIDVENDEVLKGLNFLAELYKSMKMDIDAELDEISIDHEEEGDKIKTVVTMKGLRLTCKLNK